MYIGEAVPHTVCRGVWGGQCCGITRHSREYRNRTGAEVGMETYSRNVGPQQYQFTLGLYSMENLFPARVMLCMRASKASRQAYCCIITK